jgi:hypothetical protein
LPLAIADSKVVEIFNNMRKGNFLNELSLRNVYRRFILIYLRSSSGKMKLKMPKAFLEKGEDLDERRVLLRN